MAHHSRRRGGGDAWLNITPADIAFLDAALAACVNGVDGGFYAPAGLITVGGSGLALTGPLQVARGGQLISGKGILQFAPGVYPQLSASHSGRSRKVMHSFLAARPNMHMLWRPRRDSSGMQALAPQFYSWQQPGVLQTASLSMPLRAVQGATLSGVTIGFRVGYPHLNLPLTFPSARLLRVDTNGNAVPMTSTAAGADANGWVYAPKASSPAAWYNFGVAQSFALTCDQNNVIDRTQYTYRLEVQDEQWAAGTAWPWIVNVLKPCKLCSFGTQVIGTAYNQLTGNAAYDGGVAANVGDRILVINTIGQQETGVYVQGSTAASFLQRASDFQTAAQFSQGIVVAVQQGQKFAGTVWQVSGSVASWTPGTVPLSTAGVGVQFWQASQSYPSGNYVVLPQTPSGYWYQATAGFASSGTTEPSWPTQVGATVTDSGVTWTCKGSISTPLPWVTRPDADQVTQGLGMNHYGLIWESAAVQYTNITQNAFE